MSSSTHLGPVKYIDCSCYHDSKAAVHIEPTENFDFSAALLSEYDVLDKILRYLSYRDLSNIGQVNDIWGNIADAELQKRLSPNLFSFGLTCYNAPDSITAKPSLCLVLMECNTVKLNTYICIHKEPGSEKRKSVIEFLEDDLLTTTCPIVALTCSQISSSYTGNNALNGMAFPCIPNIKLAVFRLKDSKNIPAILDENIGSENNVACLLCYALCRKKKHLHDLLTEIENRQPGVNFALGGGFVRGMQIFNVNKKKSSLQKKDEVICIAFCKPKTEEVPFNTYSIVIPETAECSEEIEHYFMELKKHYVPRKYSIAFRITCVSRNSEMQTEINLFTKHFPNIEILGFNGEGEIGWDFYKSDVGGTEEVKRLKLDKQKKVFRSLTTIIVLLTWGRRIK